MKLTKGPKALAEKLAMCPQGFPRTVEGTRLARKAVALVEKTAPEQLDDFMVSLVMLGYDPLGDVE